MTPDLGAIARCETVPVQNPEPGVLVCPDVIGVCPAPISDQFYVQEEVAC